MTWIVARPFVAAWDSDSPVLAMLLAVYPNAVKLYGETLGNLVFAELGEAAAEARHCKLAGEVAHLHRQSETTFDTQRVVQALLDRCCPLGCVTGTHLGTTIARRPYRVMNRTMSSRSFSRDALWMYIMCPAS